MEISTLLCWEERRLSSPPLLLCLPLCQFLMHRLHDIAYTSLSRSPICDDDLVFNPFPLSSLSLPETLTTPEFISISSALFIFVFLCCVCVLVPPKRWWVFHLRSFFSFPHYIMPHSCFNPNRAIECGDGSTSSIVGDHCTSHRCVCVAPIVACPNLP